MRPSLWWLTACVDVRGPDDPSTWFDAGSDYDVSEPISFTDQNYDFVGATPIADLPRADTDQTWFAPTDSPPNDTCEGWLVDAALPVEITGIVTIYPRYYYKARSGCSPSPEVLASEKFYGSFFLQDASGGTFVLGDTKVADFGVGDRVTLQVRAVRDNFALKMVAVHDVLTVQDGPEPVYYEVPTGEVGEPHVARVVRVVGTVLTAANTFGEVTLAGDTGATYLFSLDQELTRRGVTYPVGARLQVTGPVVYGFDEHMIVVMQVGQITEL